MILNNAYNPHFSNKTTFKNNSLLMKVREVSDETALKILHEQLVEKMPAKQAKSWVDKVKQVCQKFDISPRKLPLTKDRPGSLNEDEKYNFFTEIFYAVFNETGIAKLELVARKGLPQK